MSRKGENGIKYSKEEAMSNFDMDEFVAKIAMRLAEKDSSSKAIERIETTINKLSAEYSVSRTETATRLAENKIELKNLSELLLKQNGRVSSLEINTKLDREQHLQCTAPAKIAVLEQKVSENKEAINRLESKNTQNKTTKLSVIGLVLSGVAIFLAGAKLLVSIISVFVKNIF